MFLKVTRYMYMLLCVLPSVAADEIAFHCHSLVPCTAFNTASYLRTMLPLPHIPSCHFFLFSPPPPPTPCPSQMENQVIVSDYSQMDRILREERQYILDICKKIKKAGCNVLLIQKSILRWGCGKGSSRFIGCIFLVVILNWSMKRGMHYLIPRLIPISHTM